MKTKEYTDKTLASTTVEAKETLSYIIVGDPGIMPHTLFDNRKEDLALLTKPTLEPIILERIANKLNTPINKNQEKRCAQGLHI